MTVQGRNLRAALACRKYRLRWKFANGRRRTMWARTSHQMSVASRPSENDVRCTCREPAKGIKESGKYSSMEPSPMEKFMRCSESSAPGFSERGSNRAAAVVVGISKSLDNDGHRRLHSTSSTTSFMLNRRVLSAVGADRVLRVYGLGRGIPSMTVGVLLEMPRPTRNPDSHGGDMAIRRRHEMAPDLDSACRAASSRSSNSANVARVSAPNFGAGF